MAYRCILTPDQWDWCRVMAARNTQAALRAIDESGVSIARDHRDSIGFASEFCVASLYRDLPWHSLHDPFSRWDVGCFQVRGRSQAWHDLLVQRRQHDEDVIILVSKVAELEFWIQGWCYVGDAKQDRYLGNPGGEWEQRDPCWLVPVADLQPMSRIPL